METIDIRDNLAELPSAFQRTLNSTHYPMPSADNTRRQLAEAYRVRSQWWVDLTANYIPHIEASETESEWLPLVDAAKLALARAEYWGYAAEDPESSSE